MTKIKHTAATVPSPPLVFSLLPVAVLLLALTSLIVVLGVDAISDYSPFALGGASLVALILAASCRCLQRASLTQGIRRSARQILPAVLLLVLIALVSTTWMLGGIVPTLITFGLKYLNPTLFLMLACVLSAIVSVLTGSSWTTIATMGVALMGIGTVMGYSAGWVAGAIISGAYFGDKVSPLSDTTIIASGTCGVELFTHVRYLMYTTVPAITVALGVYAAVGLFGNHEAAVADGAESLLSALHNTFNITPWVLVVPAVTVLLIALRVRTEAVLGAAASMGFIAMFVAQPQLTATLDPLRVLLAHHAPHTGHAGLDNLAATGGIAGMMPTICLVISAMFFGGVMLGTGMLRTIALAFTRRLTRRSEIVGATVGSSLFLNACTADQYLPLIIGGNMYLDVYRRFGLQKRLLSRTLEDSVSVTSVLFPWHSCGITQSTVLGVATLAYLPFCIFNYLSPVMTLVMAWTGWRVRRVACELTS